MADLLSPSCQPRHGHRSTSRSQSPYVKTVRSHTTCPTPDVRPKHNTALSDPNSLRLRVPHPLRYQVRLSFPPPPACISYSSMLSPEGLTSDHPTSALLAPLCPVPSAAH
ncbi:hypothetical protein BC628DRAFT_597563 [Trametes gibbosa]|nr:hypothetical protein BC628DRAFT_597563 [Trametes gibbosa]